jgi:nucleoside-diphosphate-sugar epimerase
MRILIIGGTKFIGPHLVKRLAGMGHDVTVFHRGQTRAVSPPSVHTILGDRSRLSEHAAEFQQLAPEVVVDMIALTQQDAHGLVSIFRGIAERIVVISSADVYRAYGVFSGLEAEPVEAVAAHEDAPLRSVRYPYRKQARGPDELFYEYEKILVEEACRNEPELPATVLRLPMVYGPGDEQHRLADYLRRMDDGRPLILVGEALARFRCGRGYVEDMAAAIALAATNPRAAGRVYNVAYAEGLTEAEWIARIATAADWSGKVVTVPQSQLPVPYNPHQDLLIDSTRIRTELGYDETVTLDEALKKTISWERQNPLKTPADYSSEDALISGLGL